MTRIEDSRNKKEKKKEENEPMGSDVCNETQSRVIALIDGVLRNGTHGTGPTCVPSGSTQPPTFCFKNKKISVKLSTKLVWTVLCYF